MNLREEMANLGSLLWGLVGQDGVCDETHLVKVAETLLSQRSASPRLVGRERTAALLATVALGFWVDHGKQVIRTSHPYAAYLMAMKPRAGLGFITEAPCRAFVIEVPSGLLHILVRGRVFPIASALVARIDGGWIISAYGPDELLLQTVRRDGSLFGDEEDGADMHDDEDEDMTHNERHVMMLTRLVANLVLTMMADPDAIREEKPNGVRAKNIREGKAPPPFYRFFVLGRPVTIDCRLGVKSYLATGKTEHRDGPKVRTLVFGHRKWTCIGPREKGTLKWGTARKLITVEPYWRGPDGAPIVERPHVLKAE